MNREDVLFELFLDFEWRKFFLLSKLRWVTWNINKTQVSSPIEKGFGEHQNQKWCTSCVSSSKFFLKHRTIIPFALPDLYGLKDVCRYFGYDLEAHRKFFLGPWKKSSFDTPTKLVKDFKREKSSKKGVLEMKTSLSMSPKHFLWVSRS